MAIGSPIIGNSGVSNTDTVGDVRISLLTEAQFQNINGTDWVLMDGQSSAGSAYETLTGNSTVPDAVGRFLRMEGGAAASLGSQQADATAQNGLVVSGGTASGTFASTSHSHTDGSLYAEIGYDLAGGNIIGHRNDKGGSFTSSLDRTHSTSSASPTTVGRTDVHGTTSSPSTTASVSSTAASISASDAETRPINVTVNYFVKIN